MTAPMHQKTAGGYMRFHFQNILPMQKNTQNKTTNEQKTNAAETNHGFRQQQQQKLVEQ